MPPVQGIQKCKTPSEARKQQNRLSSQTYRKRQKQKLALLDQLLVAETTDLTSPEQTPAPPLSGEPQQVLLHQSALPDDGTWTAGICEQHAPPQHVWHEELSSSWPSDAPLSLEPLHHSNASGPGRTMVPALENQLSSSSLDPSYTMTIPFFDEWKGGDLDPSFSDLSSTTENSTSPSTSLSMPVNMRPEQDMFRVVQGISSLSIRDKHQVLEMLKSVLGSDARTLPTPTSSSSSSSIAASSPSRGLQADFIPTLADVHQQEAARFSTWLHSRCLVRQPSLSVTDPMRNSNSYRFSFWDALIANASVVRLTAQELGKHDGRSPFSMSISMSTNNNTSHELSRARAMHSTLVPRDLLPTDAQLTHPHHPFLDLIPFASFRQRAVAAMAANPSLIDWKQMCADINAAGMICWGGGTGTNGNHGDEMPTNIGFEKPWDARSWEPKVWFLKKYWFLVGGWEEEMWTSARWWAATRNEYIAYD